MGARMKRPRARDVFDICAAMDAVSLEPASVAAILPSIFEAKRVPTKLLPKLGDENVRSFHAPDFRSVEQTVRNPEDLRSFNDYYDRVLDLVSRLEISGNP